MAHDTGELTATLVTLFDELVRGAGPASGFILNPGDPGLLASLDRYGPDPTEIPTSATYYEVTASSETVAVFAVTRRGHLLAQVAGRTEIVPAILQTCRDAGVTVTGVVAEWETAEAARTALAATTGFAPAYVSKNLICHREMRYDDSNQSLDRVRRLRPGDFNNWFTL